MSGPLRDDPGVDPDVIAGLCLAVSDARLAVRIATRSARPRGPGSRTAMAVVAGFEEVADPLLTEALTASDPRRGGDALRRLCLLLAQALTALESMAEMPGVRERAGPEVLQACLELACAYRCAAALRWQEAHRGGDRRSLVHAEEGL